jgi:hypothetical protein
MRTRQLQWDLATLSIFHVHFEIDRLGRQGHALFAFAAPSQLSTSAVCSRLWKESALLRSATSRIPNAILQLSKVLPVLATSTLYTIFTRCLTRLSAFCHEGWSSDTLRSQPPSWDSSSKISEAL